VIDLFAGCGGLALGFEVAGFRTVGYEMAFSPARTYTCNLDGDCHQKKLDVGDDLGPAEVVIGGPPCQPFSQIGYQRGRHDDRDGFPIFLDIVRRSSPKIAILENVRGLLFRNKDYLKQTLRELQSFGYDVDYKLMNAADYGVPQKRERVAIVATRCGWQWPSPVVYSPVTAGVALGDSVNHHFKGSRFLTQGMDAYIATYEAKSACVRPRDLHLDKPSRTLTCRNLGGATADMLRIRLPDGRRRMLHVQEASRLQSFPDWFGFTGSQGDVLEQIGNSVAPLMGLALARSAMAALKGKVRGLAAVVASAAGSHEPVKSEGQLELFMKPDANEKLEQALTIMRCVGLPLREFTPRRRERVALALLAVAGVQPNDNWSQSRGMGDGHGPLQTRAIIRFWNEHYGQSVADSSYDDVRRKDLIHLVEFGLVNKSAANPHADTNDGTRGYAMTDGGLALLRSYGASEWETQLARFRAEAGEVADRLSKAREMKMVPVILPNGTPLKLDPGPHNELQRDIIESFLSRFAHGCEVLYIGDASNKLLYVNSDRLAGIGLPPPSRETLPDVVAYVQEKGWVFFVEAVTSFNPISDMRREQLRRHAQTKGMNHKIIFVTAFPDRKTFAKFSQQIGWETEVWIASHPAHMIHFDGKRYLQPYD
jgi:DNA (cytosine-5)-methyltransferase 1